MEKEQGEGITLENGTVLKVGEKYKRLNWEDNCFVKIVAFGEKCFLCLNEDNEDYFGDINMDWLPYTDPKEESKPFEGYQKYYADNGNGLLFIQYWATRPNNTNKLKWYSESEAIELGLTI